MISCLRSCAVERPAVPTFSRDAFEAQLRRSATAYIERFHRRGRPVLISIVILRSVLFVRRRTYGFGGGGYLPGAPSLRERSLRRRVGTLSSRAEQSRDLLFRHSAGSLRSPAPEERHSLHRALSPQRTPGSYFNCHPEERVVCATKDLWIWRRRLRAGCPILAGALFATWEPCHLERSMISCLRSCAVERLAVPTFCRDAFEAPLRRSATA